jgi:hypothetical protein
MNLEKTGRRGAGRRGTTCTFLLRAGGAPLPSFSGGRLRIVLMTNFNY